MIWGTAMTITDERETSIPYASRGSQRWLQMAVARTPYLLDAALRRAGVMAEEDSVEWRSPISSTRFMEYRDGAALSLLGIDTLPKQSLADFWPSGGPVWDALGVSTAGVKILVEAKAHIAEAASPASKASPDSLARIRRSLAAARKHYAPRATAEWSGSLYQYANRLAFQFFLNSVNGTPSKLVFLDFCNATDVNGPRDEAEWRGATEMIHALLGIPSDLSRFGVYHAYLDVRRLETLA
jgi:hypothetical protein